MYFLRYWISKGRHWHKERYQMGSMFKEQQRNIFLFLTFSLSLCVSGTICRCPTEQVFVRIEITTVVFGQLLRQTGYTPAKMLGGHAVTTPED